MARMPWVTRKVDEHGAVVPGTQRPLTRFDPSQTVICLPLGPSKLPARDVGVWSRYRPKNHNFHIHQTRIPDRWPGRGIFQDNIPMGVAVQNIPEVMEKQYGVCTIDQWRNGQCSSTPIVIDIPFSQLGEFVYHWPHTRT